MNSLKKKKIVLCIMDGFGLAPESPANAISLAKTKNLDRIFRKYPHCKLGASENVAPAPCFRGSRLSGGRATPSDENFKTLTLFFD